MVDTIYLDDGRIIDVRGESVRTAIDKVRSATGALDPLAQWKVKPTAEAIEAHYPDSQHQPDECEMCRFIHDAAKAFVSSTKARP